MRMMGKAELFRIPIFGAALRAVECIPVDRGNRASAAAATTEMKAKIESGLSIWVAPEGTRSVGAELGEFKRGAFATAIKDQVPIQPMVVLDSFKAMPKGSYLPRTGSVIHVCLLPQVETKGLTVEDRKTLADNIREQMMVALRELLAQYP